jgi:hypothetical protein
MLPDFKVPIELQPGAQQALLVRDVAACVFWQGYPELTEDTSMRAARDRRLAELRWFEHLLARVTIRPSLTVEMVRRMGGDSWLPIRHYLEVVGYFPHVVSEAVEAAGILDVFPDHETAAAQHLEAFRAALPPRPIRLLLRELSGPMHLSAPALWLAPISEVLFGYHVYLADQVKAVVPLPDFAAAQRPPTWLPPSLPA